MTRTLRSLTFRCRGHRHLKATHAKTLEWTLAEEISPRATCVVGVAADFDPREASRLRGPLRIEMEVEGHPAVESLTATATPLMAARDALVVRRSDEQGGRTFAFGADRGAADLDRAFVRALTHPDGVLAVRITEAPVPDAAAAGVLLLTHSPAAPEAPGGDAGPVAPGAEAAARLAAADTTVTVEALGRTPGRQALLQRLAEGERVALQGEPLDPRVREIAGAALAAGVTVTPVWGVEPWQAVVAASGVPGPVHLHPEAARKVAVLRRWLEAPRPTEGVTVLAVHLPLTATLDCLREALGPAHPPLTLGRGLLTRREALVRGTAEELLTALPGTAGETRQPSESLLLALPPADTGDGLGPLASVLESLLAEGVPVRTLAEAAARFPGVARRDAYRALLRRVEGRQG
jgi:16S rRNA C1402 (ribose-2'-O) methylase RsmI